MATPNLTTEVTAQPIFPVETEEDWTAKTIIFDDRTSQAYYIADKHPRRFTLQYSPLSLTDFNSLRNFLIARKGNYEKFYWNYPVLAEVDIPVRLVDNGFKWRLLTPVVWEATVTLEEVA